MFPTGYRAVTASTVCLGMTVLALLTTDVVRAAPVAEPPPPIQMDVPRFESPSLQRPTSSELPGPSAISKDSSKATTMQPAPAVEPQLSDGRLDELDAADEDIDKLEMLATDATTRSSRKAKVRAGVAARVLGLIYLHGAGVPVDFIKAESWFRRAVELGDRRAAAGLAWCAIDGCSDVPKPLEASRWTEVLQRVDKARALTLRWLAKDRIAPLAVARPGLSGTAEPPIHDRDWLEQAARQGSTYAAIEMGLALVERGDTTGALRWFDLAAPSSNVAAENARLLRDRDTGLPPPRRPRAQIQVQEAPGQDVYDKALRFHRGVGVPANYTEAIRLYRAAEAAGNPTAKRMLELIFARPLIGGLPDLDWMRQLAWADVSGAAPTATPMGYDQLLRRELTPLVDMLPQRWRQQLPLD